MPSRETYYCANCEWDTENESDLQWSESYGDDLCEDCFIEYGEDGDHYAPGGLFVPPIEDATPGDIVTSVRAVGVEWEQDGGSASSVVAAVGSLLLESKGEHCGHEFVTQPQRGSSVESMVRVMSGALAAAGFAPTDDCGTHFHVDMTGESMPARYRVAAALGMAEDLIFALARGRRAKSWCQPIAATWNTSPAAMLETAARGENGEDVRDVRYVQSDRYTGVNLHALSAHGTIEVRVMDGDAQVDTRRLLLAIATATAVADYAATAPAATLAAFLGDPAALLRATAMPADLVAEVITSWEQEDSRERDAVALRAARRARERAAQSAFDTARRDARDAYDTLRRYAEQRADRTALTAAQQRHALADAEVRALRDALRDAEYRRNATDDALYRARTALTDAVRGVIAECEREYRDALNVAEQAYTRAVAAE